MTDKLPPVPELLLCTLPWSMRDHVEQWMTDYARQAVREAVPEGFVLVPVEPTEAMRSAGCKYFKANYMDIFDSAVHFKLMIAAAKESDE